MRVGLHDVLDGLAGELLDARPSSLGGQLRDAVVTGPELAGERHGERLGCFSMDFFFGN